MTDMNNATKAEMITRARAVAAEDSGFGNFLFHTIGSIEDSDLEGISADVLEQVLKHSFARFGQRAANEHLINIWRPDGAMGVNTQIVDIFIDDMPFLVDSVLGALRAKGATIKLVAHPVLPVNATRKPFLVLREANETARLESFLHIHIAPITDEAVLDEMFAEVDGVLKDVRRTVQGWRPMLERLRLLVQTYRQHPPKVPAPTLAEALHFLAWLADHNFTFLGMREYRLVGTGASAKLELVVQSGLGILEDPDFHFLRHGSEYVEMTEQHVAFLAEPQPLMVTKANVRSRVHRRGHMDYVGVKLYGPEGELTGELRIVGLFTSMSLATPHTEVPLVRQKISEVMKRSGRDLRSHGGKALMAALDSYPREELFQITEKQLFDFATIISTLADRPRVEVLPRIDRFDNFVSVLLFLPRDRYNSNVRQAIGEHLAERYEGRVSAYYPHFPEGDLVRVHFIIGRNGGKTPQPDHGELVDEVTALTRTFGDRLMTASDDPGSLLDYWDAFPPEYQAHYTHLDALEDIKTIRPLAGNSNMAVKLTRAMHGHGHGHGVGLGLKVYHPGTPIPLSARVPMLENFGFRVIDERTVTISPRGMPPVFLHDMSIEAADGAVLDLDAVSGPVETALIAVWSGEAESDGYNRLTLTARLAWDDAAILRAFGLYLRQIGVTYSQRYMWEALAQNPLLAAGLVELFHTMHDPAASGNREAFAQSIGDEIRTRLNDIQSIDEDRILRHFLNLVEASVRTNFYQRGAEGERRPALATKYDSSKVEGLPAPRPFREIHVYSPRVEGVHMRGGPIARGGIRWSDRPEDFRTEVLGLVKAQMVKNAVIVPAGAKGGFVPKQMPVGGDRDAILAEGTECYKIFIGSLLDITDNLDGDKVVPPPDLVRHDGDDPYLVVAADKGTASFSDLANSISTGRHFWLGDAFASGGSAGYDHKKMGITARGAFEAVRRHFREMNRNIDAEPFTVAGVGDMSGDVFGNGMLLSRRTRLIAAFDHRDIFIDPDPDPETSFIERKRLFDMGRSSWQDYDQTLLSAGGGIFARNQKAISLSAEAQTALMINLESVTPQVLMKAILRANVDLLWFGGIGTYVRAQDENNLEAGDRANDSVRITGSEIRALVVGEGANLALTQKGRIEFADKGGRINTDAIDNSAGVNSSDLEVNIKIALASLIRAGTLKTEARNVFLSEMTSEVAALCIRNNYLQTLALSLAERRGVADLPEHQAFMQALEAKGELDRAVEYLPDDALLAARLGAGHGLSRPELSVLLAYAKNDLNAALLRSDVPDDPYLSRELFRYFPVKLKDKYPETIETHRLRREVIATVLCNAMVNRGGPSFVHRVTSATSADAGQVAFAHAAARDAFGLQELNGMIDALDDQIDGATQIDLYRMVQNLQIEQTLWFLRNVKFEGGLSSVIARYRDGTGQVRANLAANLPKFVADSIAAQAGRYEMGRTPPDLARRIAELSALTLASDIVLIAEQTGTLVADAALAYFTVLEAFKLGRITEQGSGIHLLDRFDRMALDRALANVMRAQRDLTIDVLKAGKGAIPARFSKWHDMRAAEIDRIIGTVTDLTEGELTVSRLSVAAGLLSDLVRA